MTSCCHPHRMPWSGATGAIARGKRVSTGCGRKRRSVRVLRWICGVKLKPKAVNKPLPYFIVHELDKPGSSATVSFFLSLIKLNSYSLACGLTRFVGSCPLLVMFEAFQYIKVFI